MPVPALGFIGSEQNFEVKADTMSLNRAAREPTHQIQQSGRCDRTEILAPDVPRSVPCTSVPLDPGRYHSEHDPIGASVALTSTRSAPVQSHAILPSSRTEAFGLDSRCNLSGQFTTPSDSVPRSVDAAITRESPTKRPADDGTLVGKIGRVAGSDSQAQESDLESTAMKHIGMRREAAISGDDCNGSLPPATQHDTFGEAYGETEGCCDVEISNSSRFIAEFARLALIECTFEVTPTEQNQIGASESTSSCVSVYSNGSASSENPTRNRQQHARRLGDREDDDSEDEENSSEHNHKDAQDRAKASHTWKTFACPILSYHLWSNNCFPEKPCLGYAFRKISVLKQHLRRVHKIGLHCPECFEEFKQQSSLDKHKHRAECSPSDSNATLVANKIKPAVWNVIYKRHRNLDPQEYWDKMYRNLFPDQEVPWSPYTGDQIYGKPVLHMVDLLNHLDPMYRNMVLNILQENSASGRALPERTRYIVREAVKRTSQLHPEEQATEPKYTEYQAVPMCQGYPQLPMSAPNSDFGIDYGEMDLDQDRRIHTAGSALLNIQDWTTVWEHGDSYAFYPVESNAYALPQHSTQQTNPEFGDWTNYRPTYLNAPNQAPGMLGQDSAIRYRTDSSSQNTVTVGNWPFCSGRKDSTSQFSHSSSSITDLHPGSDDSWNI